MATIEKSIEVSVPLRVAYNQWTQFEQFDRFMDDVREVKQIDDTHLHWKTEMDNKETELDCEITEQVPDKRIAWRSKGVVSATGDVTFRPISHDRTEVRLMTEFDPKDLGADSEEIIAKGEAKMENGLTRFKQFIEWLDRETGAWRSRAQGAKALEEPVKFAQEFTRQVEKQMESATETITRNLPAFWQEPFGMFRRMWGDMDQLFESFAARPLATAARQQPAGTLAFSWQPRLDMVQQQDDVLVCADLPGLRPNDVRVQLTADSLILEGQRETEVKSGGNGAIRSERSYGRFYRVISLPKGLDIGGAKASMKEGVLKVTIPVSQAMRGRQLEVESAEMSGMPAGRYGQGEPYREPQYAQSGQQQSSPELQYGQAGQDQKERRHVERRQRVATP